MTRLVEVIAKALVEDPDAVQVTETEKDGQTVIELRVADKDMSCGEWTAGSFEDRRRGK